MSDKEAAVKILPRTPKDRNTLRLVGGYLALVVIFVVIVLFFQHRRRQEMENTWQSAAATIDDVRPVVASQVNSEIGSAMLYQIEILVHYAANGDDQHRWIRIENIPGSNANKNQIYLAGRANSASSGGKFRSRI
jgi:hypothetical protein